MANVAAFSSSYGKAPYPLSQSTVHKPFYATGSNADAQMMGGPTLVFTPSDRLERDGVDGFTALPGPTNEWSMLSFVSLQNPTDTGADHQFSSFANASGQVVLMGWDSGAGKHTVQGHLTTTAVSSSLSGSGMVYIVRDDSANFRLSVNEATGSAATSFNYATDKFRMGSRAHSSAGELLSGTIKEMVFVSRSLQNVEVEGYKRHVLKNYLNPTKIPNLTHRFQAGSKTEIDSTGDVTQWEDLVGTAVVSQSADAQQPGLVRYTPEFANGRSYITASNAAHRMTGPAAPISGSFSGDYSLFCVIEKDSIASQHMFDLWSPTSDDTPPERITLLATTDGLVRLGLTEGASSTNFDSPTGRAQDGLVVIVVSYDATGTANFVINGVESSVTSTPRSPVIGSTGSYYLMNRTGNNQPARKMFEFNIFDRALAVGEMQNLTAYARLYYGID